MAYIEWWNRTGPITLGERFGLNEISTARETLSPTKSYINDRVDMKPGGIVEPGVTHYAKKVYKGMVPHTDEVAAEIYGDFLKGKKWSEMSKQEKRIASGSRHREENWKAIKKRNKEFYEKHYVPLAKTPLQIEAAEQLEWISKNAKNYSNPKLLQEKFMTHFKIKDLEKAAVFKNAMAAKGASRSLVVSNVPNIKGILMGKRLPSGKYSFIFTSNFLVF